MKSILSILYTIRSFRLSAVVLLVILTLVVPSFRVASAQSAEAVSSSETKTETKVEGSDTASDIDASTGKEEENPKEEIIADESPKEDSDEETNEKPKDEETDEKPIEPTEESLVSAEVPNPSFKLPAQTKPSVDLSSGALTYGYSFEFAEGRNSLTPELSLSYNSRKSSDPNSFVGLGWDLSIPYIQREAIEGTENIFAKPFFSSSISGNLIATSSTSSSQFVEYRPETDNGDYLKYTYLADNSWSMTGKDGKTYVFGVAASSRQDHPTDPSKVYKWMLSKIIDSYGNEIQYSYIKETGQIYPSQIAYAYHPSAPAVNTISFNYTTPASYGATTYNASFPITTKKLLSSVVGTTNTTGTSGFATTRTYNLNYSDAQFLKFKNLASVQKVFSMPYIEYQQNFNDTTTFSYSTKTPGWEESNFSLESINSFFVYSGNYGTKGAFRADFDNNGYEDLVFSYGVNYEPWVASKLMLNTGSQFVDSTTAWQFPQKYMDSYGIVDVNGDQLPDLLPRNPGDHSYLNTGSGFVVDTSSRWKIHTYFSPNPYQVLGPNTGGTDSYYLNTFVSDINGDGKGDLLHFGGPSDFQVFLNNGDRWTLSNDYNFIGKTGANYDFSVWQQNRFFQTLMDVNGDGRLDFVHAKFGTYLNTGTGFAYSEAYGMHLTERGERATFTDFNGDGLIDYASVIYVSGSMVYQSFVNSGSGFTKVYQPTTTYWNPLPFSLTTTNPIMRGTAIDVTADGYPDVVTSARGQSAGYVRAINNGQDAWASNPMATDQWKNSVAPYYGLYFDINNDGVLDFMSPGGSVTNVSNPKRIYLGKPDVPNRLSKITTSLGSQTNISYSAARINLSDISASTIGVVKQISVTNIGSGQPNMVSSFTYVGGKYIIDPATKQKRFAGFSKVTSTESGDNLAPLRVTENYFHQANGSDSATNEPTDTSISLVGKKYYSVVSNPAGTLKKEEWNKYGIHNLSLESATNRESNFVYQTEVTSKHTDALSTVATATSFETDTNIGEQTSVLQLGLVNVDSAGLYQDIDPSDNRLSQKEFVGNAPGTIIKAKREQVVNASNPTEVNTRTDYFYDNLAFGSVGSSGSLTKETSWVSGNGSVVADNSYVYDSFGNLLSATNPVGAISSFAYDASKTFVTSTTNNLGHTTSYLYTNDKVKQKTDPNGQVTIYGYTDTGMLYRQTVQNTGGSKRTRQLFTGSVGVWYTLTLDQLVNTGEDRKYQMYDNLGRPTRVIHQLRNHETNVYGSTYIKELKTYDALGRNITTSLPSSEPFATDSGPILTAPVPSELTTTTTFDVFDRPLSVSNVLGVTNYEYSGLETKTTDPNLKVKKTKTDAFGNLVEVTERNSGEEFVTRYDYNNRNQLIKLTDALQNIRNFEYNNAGWVTRSEDLHTSADLDFGVYNYTYDVNGSKLSETQPNGVSVNYLYDSLGRLISTDGSTTPGVDFAYTYDSCTFGLGRLCSSNGILQDEVTINKSFVYGISGVPTSESVTTLGNTYTTNYFYGLSDQVNKITYPNNTIVRTTFGDWALPNKVFVALPGQAESLYASTAYNFLQLPTLVTNPNGLTTSYTYDSSKLHRKTAMLATRNGATVQSYNYTYDKVGNITKVIEPSLVKTYTYDDLYRLTSAIHTPAVGDSTNYNYEYDAIGNIVSANGQTYAYSGTGKTNPHAVTSVGVDAYSYDGNGNISSAPNQSFTFNWQNQPTRITQGGSANFNSYYDDAGQRLVYQTPTSTEIQVSGEYLLRDANAEITVSIGNLPVGTISNGSVTSTITDHLGTTIKQVDNAGSVVEDVSYTPFGKVLVQTGSLNTKRGYTGHAEDVDTGLVYAKARYYNPNIGRFTSQDKVHLSVGSPNAIKNSTGLEFQTYLLDPQSFNSYAYARNNPIIYHDPSGDFAFLVPLAYAVAASALVYAPVAVNYMNSLLTPLGQHSVATAVDDYQKGNTTVAAVGVLTAGQGNGSSSVVRNVLPSINGKIIQATRPVKELILKERTDIIGKAVATGDSETVRIFETLYKKSDELLGGTAGALRFETKHNITLSRSLSGHLTATSERVSRINKHITRLGNSNPSATQMLLTERRNLKRALFKAKK